MTKLITMQSQVCAANAADRGGVAADGKAKLQPSDHVRRLSSNAGRLEICDAIVLWHADLASLWLSAVRSAAVGIWKDLPCPCRRPAKLVAHKDSEAA